jgi:hypothetical protein
MSSRVGGRRSVSFPIIPDEHRADIVRPAAVDEDMSAIVIWRNLLQDNRLIREKLEGLGVNPNGMHGDLQVTLSGLRRMTAAVQRLIAAAETGEPDKTGRKIP